MVRGLDPYAFVAGARTPFTPTLFYPLPAAFLAMPLMQISAQLAGSLFVGFGFAALAFVVTRDGWWRLIMFVSAPAYEVCYCVQWSPLLMTAAIVTPLLGLIVCKPNLALPLLGFQSDAAAIWKAILGGGALVAISLVLQPSWPLHWYRSVHNAPVATQYRIPITTAWGAVVALAALRWRRPEARLVLFMACVPQNGFFYDQFPLLLVPNSRRELLISSAVSQCVLFIPQVIHFAARDTAELSVKYIPLMIVGAYLPALIMVLRRPNEVRRRNGSNA